MITGSGWRNFGPGNHWGISGDPGRMNGIRNSIHHRVIFRISSSFDSWWIGGFHRPKNLEESPTPGSRGVRVGNPSRKILTGSFIFAESNGKISKLEIFLQKFAFNGRSDFPDVVRVNFSIGADTPTQSFTHRHTHTHTHWHTHWHTHTHTEAKPWHSVGLCGTSRRFFGQSLFIRWRESTLLCSDASATATLNNSNNKLQQQQLLQLPEKKKPETITSAPGYIH